MSASALVQVRVDLAIEADEVEAHFAKRRAAAVSKTLEQAEESEGSRAPRGARPRLAHVRKGKN